MHQHRNRKRLQKARVQQHRRARRLSPFTRRTRLLQSPSMPTWPNGISPRAVRGLSSCSGLRGYLRPWKIVATCPAWITCVSVCKIGRNRSRTFQSMQTRAPPSPQKEFRSLVFIATLRATAALQAASPIPRRCWIFRKSGPYRQASPCIIRSSLTINSFPTITAKRCAVVHLVDQHQRRQRHANAPETGSAGTVFSFMVKWNKMPAR